MTRFPRSPGDRPEPGAPSPHGRDSEARFDETEPDDEYEDEDLVDKFADEKLIARDLPHG